MDKPRGYSNQRGGRYRDSQDYSNTPRSNPPNGGQDNATHQKERIVQVDSEEQKKIEQQRKLERERITQRKAEEYEKKKQGRNSPSNQNVDSSWGGEAEREHQANNRKKERQEYPRREEATAAPAHQNPTHSNPAHPIPVVATSPTPNAHHDREVPHWAVEDVHNWLQENGFSILCRKFKENDIDGEALLLMHFEDLRELNINLGIRLKLWSRIEEIGGQVRSGGGADKKRKRKTAPQET